MKITDIDIFKMRTPVHKTAGTNWMFVRITTDTREYGWGETSTQYKDAGVAAEIKDFAKYLIGKDPFQIEHIWTSLYRRVTWTGGAVTMSAISGIDLALNDLKAKSLGIPVYELLGGKVRDDIRAYANGWFDPTEDDGLGSAALTIDDFARRSAELVDEGWQAMKFYPFAGPQVIDPERMERGVELVKAVREAVGGSIEVAVDVRGRLDIWSARRAARLIEDYNVAWLEEPILWDNIDALAALARDINIPISTGEQLYNRWDFRPLLESHAASVIQPDICHAGGITELRKIATAAETHYVSVAPHNSNGPISTVASLHLDLVMPNAFMQEIFVSFLGAYEAVLTNMIPIADGRATVPDGPGWGTEIDVTALEAFPPCDYVTVESEPYLAF